MQFSRREPDAMMVPEGETRLTPVAWKLALQGSKSIRRATESRWTVDVGMKRALSRVIVCPRPTLSLMEPMPTALMDEPPTPLTCRLAMGRREKKSSRSGVMYVEQPVSRRNGDVSRETSREPAGVGDTAIAETSMSLKCSVQSTEQTSSSQDSSWEKLAYSSISAGVIASATISAMSSVSKATWASQSGIRSRGMTMLEASSRMYARFSLSR